MENYEGNFVIENGFVKRFRGFGYKEIIIPEGVTGIKHDAFLFCRGVERITLPESLHDFEVPFFSSMSNLKEVHISSLEAWLKNNFENEFCNPLYDGHNLYLNGELVQDLVIPEGVTEIHDYAFVRCTGIRTLTLPSTLTYIGDKAFSGCASLERITYNGSNLNFGKNVFSGCESLDDMIILNGVLYRYIGNDESVVIPDGVTRIADKAFEWCGSLVSVKIPSSVVSIDSKAFDMGYVGKLKEVHITDFDAWCNIEFADCYSNPLYNAHDLYLNGELLGDLVITDSMTSINKYAFCGCRSIRRVYINDIESWYNGAYKVTSDLPSYELYLNGELVSQLIISDSITEIPEGCFSNCNSLTEIMIPSSVVSIGKYAFCGCSSLVSITIPSSVTNIGEKAFIRCTSLKEVHVSDISACCGIDFKKGDDSLLGYYSNPMCHAHDLVIPDGVSSIGEAAFFGCTSLVSIKIPDSVTNIGKKAFGECKSLERITIPDSITNIEEVFYGCPALHYYYVCEDATIIKRYAFDIPSEIDKAYETARMNYTITYYHEDSADDDGDNGMGYDYDNSYVIHRAPKKEEIIIKNGKLYGFVVCGEKKPLLISGAETVTADRHNSPRYKSGYTWNLTYDPCIPRYMWVPGMEASSKYHRFAPKDFPENLVKAVVKQVGIQDNRGYFDGKFDVTVELTDAAVTDPAGTMDKFLSFNSRSTLLKHP